MYTRNVLQLYNSPRVLSDNLFIIFVNIIIKLQTHILKCKYWCERLIGHLGLPDRRNHT